MFDVQDFVARCKEAAGAPDGARRVLELMRGAVGHPEEIRKAVTPSGSGRAILDAPLHRSQDLVVLNATLLPLFASAPHDHRIWAVVGIYEGQEDNTFYRRAGNGLEEMNRREVCAGEAILLGPDVIHAIRNPLGSRTLGLHVYGGDLAAAERSMWDPRTAKEHPFDAPRFFAWCAELSGAARAS